MSLQTLDKVLSKTADRSVGDLVATYGSNMQRLKMDAAAGKVDPTKALMAMMMIQRIVAANTQPSSGTTVAQDAGLTPPPQPMGMSAIAPPAAPQQPPIAPQQPPTAPQQPPTRMAYGGQVAVSNNQVPSPAMERGLDGIPIPDNMFDYADGGMVAFAGGGDVQRFQTGNPVQAPTEVFLLQRLLQSAIANGERPEKIAEIQAALNAATSGAAKPTAPAAAPTATPPAAGEPVRGPGITLNSALQRLSTPMQVASPNITALQEQTKQMYPDVTIEAPDRGKISTEQLEAAKKFGYDPNLAATQKAEYETEREGLKTQRKEAADMAILKAGLNILGGTSPHAFVNIGKGGSEAAQEFGKDIREIQKLGMQLKKEQQALERAANQDALQRSDKTEAAYRDALARKEAAEQKVLDRRASTFNALLQGEYGNLREQAQQMGANLRQVASTLGSIEQVERTTSAYGGDRRSEYARATDTHYANFKRLRDAGDPEYADKSDTELMAMASDKTQRQMRQAEPREMVAGAAASRADTERREQRSKIENRIKLLDKTYKELARDPKTKAEAAEYLKRKVDEQMPEVSASASPEKPAVTPPKPTNLPANTKLGAYVPGKGWEVYGADGALKGYMQR